MIAFPRQKDPAFLARIQLAVVTFDRHPKSKDTTRHGLALRLFVTAGVLAMSAPIFGQETVPSVFPSTQVGTVQPVPDASIPPSVDLTIPSIDAGTAPSTSTTSETPLIPQEAPQSTPAIQPAAVQGQDSVDLGQNPPAPLPQPEAALPPINADEMADDDRDELLRGPVHEAFAEQFNADPVPGLVVPQKPPEAIEEVPPELKPDGRQVEWISGYWAWDEDQDDFIWVSGVWREIPQGFRWLPGYWTEVEGGYQWVSGTWVSTQTSEIDYLNDAPPETLEQGPVGVAPTNEHIWVPGSWMWSDTRYVWRPGYWSMGYTNWVWVPARYQWTPRGYYFCDGYWDYPVARRGVLFAPSHFNRRFRYRRISRFTPRIVVASNLLTVHFWVRPRYRHYYFGNYYDVAWNNRGLTPWHQFPRQRRHFDPLYAYYGRGRNNDYFNQLNVQFNVFVNQPNRRPPVRFRDQDRWVQDHRDFRSHDLLGNRFQNFVDASRQDRDGFQFVRLENQQRERVQQETVRLRELVNQRRDVERSIAQLDRLRDRDNDGGRAGNGPNGLLNGSRDGDGRPDRDRGDDPRIGELRDRIDDAANGPPGENPVTVGNQDRETRGRDRLKLGDTTRNERPERPGRDGNKADDAVGNGLTDGKIAIDNPSPGDGGNGRGDANDGDSRGAKGNTRDDLNAGPPNETVGSDTGRGDRGGNRNPQGEKTAGDVGTAIIAGESDANAKPPEQDRQGRRERLKLPPASNANENPASRNVRSRGNDNVSNGAQSLPSDGRNAGNGIDASKPSTGGIPDIGRDTPVPDNKKERSNLSNSNGNAEPPVRRRGSDRPSLQLPGTEPPAAQTGRDNSSRTRQPVGSVITNPAPGNNEGPPSSDTTPRLRDSGASRRSQGESSRGESSRSPAIPKRNPSAEQSASGVGPGSPPMGIAPGGPDRPTRRESTPKVDNAAPRVRSSEGRGNPSGGGPPIKFGNDSPGAAREPKNAPSMSIPRGDNGGARNINPGRAESGRMDAGRAARPESRAPRMESRPEGRAANPARNAGGGPPAGGGREGGGRRGSDRGK